MTIASVKARIAAAKARKVEEHRRALAMSALWRLEAERIAGELTAMRAKEREE